MRAFLATIVFTTAVAVVAFPSAHPRVEDPCAKLGPGSTGNSGPFTLRAVKKADVTTGMGNPLVLSGAIDGSPDVDRRTLAVLEQEIDPSSEAASFSLWNRHLMKVQAGANVASAFNVSLGKPLELEMNALPMARAEVYCSATDVNFGGVRPMYPALAVSGDVDNFAICAASGVSGAKVLIYKPVENTGLYDIKSCEAVAVELADA